MAKASALFLAIAACGALPVEASRMKPLNDGPLVAYDDGEQLVVAPRGCADSTCMTPIGTRAKEVSFSRIEPLAPGGWFLVRRYYSSHTWHGDGSGDLGTIVQLAIPPRIGCELALSSYGCNSEWGYCTSTDVQLVAGGDGSFVAHTTATGGRDQDVGSRHTCERLAIGPYGCERRDVACP